MIIPVKCFTCNSLISSKYKKYLDFKENGFSPKDIFKILNVRRNCCKTLMLTHVDIVENLN